MPNTVDKYIASYPNLTLEEFRIFSKFVEDFLGIKMPESKITMLQARLQGRLRALKLQTYQEYIEYVFRKKLGKVNEEEIVHLIDVVTTNKTEFFRESDHFTFIMKTALPSLLQRTNQIKIWSAGCSTGEEPYTLCMVMEKYKAEHNVDFQYSILATDISTRVLGVAKNGIYPMQTVEKLADPLKKLGFLRSRDKAKDVVRVKPELRSKVSFNRLNFMDNKFDVGQFHIIFCRNVLIYFDKPTQETVIGKFCGHLDDKGFLFLGHSETVMGMKLPLKTLAHTVYGKKV